jgi:chromosomal replication initiator protein
MRLAILKSKMEKEQVFLEDKTLELIASKVQRNIRELEGVLNKVIFYTSFKKERVDEKKIDDIVNEITQVSHKNITPQEIVKVVSDFFEISMSDLINKGRKKEVVEPRQIAMFLLRDMLKLSYPHIGERMGKRDHTTVIHACEKITKELTENQQLNQKILLLRERLYKSG